MLPEWSDVLVAARATGATLLAISVPFVIWRLATALPLGRQRYCPGPRLHWRRWLWPGAWFRAFPCGYLLENLPASGPGEVRCPECGRRVRASYQALRRVSRWRPGTIALVCGLTGSWLLYVVYAKAGRWRDCVPTTLLIAGKRGLGGHFPARLRGELAARIQDDKLTSWQQAPAVDVLFRDLRSDEESRNARQAVDLLQRANLSLEQLEERLRAEDRQERQLVAAILRERCSAWFDGKWLAVFDPSDELLAATAEGLAADDLDWYTSPSDNATQGFWFLSRFPDRIGPLIESGLLSTDEQRRFLSAALAAHTGKTELLPFAAPILIEHLRDNQVGGDARFAIRCLYRFGPQVVPFVRPHVDAEDAQLAAAARMVLRDLGAAAPAPDPRAPTLSVLTRDPAGTDTGCRIPADLSR